MVLDLVRLAEHVHGHLGWLAAAALVHPAILLKNPQRRAHLSVGLSAGLVSLAGLLGVLLYPEYRSRLKQQIFLHAPVVGYLFERKEHLAFGAIVLTWAGSVAYFLAVSVDESLRVPLRAFAFRAYVIAAALSVAVAVLGTLVATYRTF